MLSKTTHQRPMRCFSKVKRQEKKHKREDDLPMRNVKSSAPNRKNIYQIEHTQKRILTPFSILEDHPPAQIENDDQDWSAIKTRALEDLGEHFNTNIIDPETKEDIMKQVSCKTSFLIPTRGHDNRRCSTPPLTSRSGKVCPTACGKCETSSGRR